MIIQHFFIQVFIRPNKVVYLPSTFMEENFDPGSLPVNCSMIVETNGEELVCGGGSMGD